MDEPGCDWCGDPATTTVTYRHPATGRLLDAGITCDRDKAGDARRAGVTMILAPLTTSVY
jgi:hypothetical protein